MKSLKAIFRRQKDQSQAQAGEDLSRASSISNLNENSKKAGALAKVRKSVSKDRLDNGEKRIDKKGCRNNNHQIELDGVGDEVEGLQKQLEAMTSEKAELVLQLGENRNQLSSLQGEIQRLKEQSAVQMEQLNGENAALRNKLRDVVCSPLSDNEKQMLLLDSQRHHSSAPASIATNAMNEGDATTCSTPDWDKESSSNVSEVSVACLQDKINQMQETHYSTNEELQATLQELTDLQRQLSELQQDNERLMEEKNLMFQSLCRQTERLNDARNEIDSLKQLLYKEKDTSGQYESVVEREQKLLELLKDSQAEREMLFVKLEKQSAEITDVTNVNIQRDNQNMQLEERVRTLESTLDAKHAEHKLLDQEMARAKDAASSRQIEIDRLKDLLENARTKIVELEQDRTVSDKSELEELLDNARKEKDLLESEVANLKEQVARGRNDGEKLREQVSILQEEFKVLRNNGKCMQSELEYKVEKLLMEKSQLTEQLQHLEEAAKELQVQAQCHLEDKHQLSSVLSETQRNMSEVERKNLEMETELRQLEKIRFEESEEWDKFQKDLLTSVRVANDFKTEAQLELQKLVLENKAHRDKIRQLEAQLEKLKENVQTVIGGIKPKPKSGNEFEEYLFNTSPIDIVDEEYEKINKSIPFELLTPQQQFIVKLKCSNDMFLMRQKAEKRHMGPKKSVAISKPLLESVFENPRLKDIAESEEFTNVEPSLNMEKSSALDPDEAHIVKQTLEGRASDMSEYQDSILMTHYSNPSEVRRLGVVGKSFSLSNLDLEPEELFLNIDENTPEDQLDKDGKYILRLKKALNKMGPKIALKKKNFDKKKVVISSPSLESAMSNENLADILTNPSVMTVRAETDSIERYQDTSKTMRSVDLEPNLHKISSRPESLRLKIGLGTKAGYNVLEAEHVARVSGDSFESYTKVNKDPNLETYKPLKELKANQAKEYLRNSLLDMEGISMRDDKFYDDEYLYDSSIYESIANENNYSELVKDALDRRGNYSWGSVSDSKITLFSSSDSPPKIFKEGGNELSFKTFGKSTPNLADKPNSRLDQRAMSESCLLNGFSEESSLKRIENSGDLNLLDQVDNKKFPEYAMVNKDNKLNKLGALGGIRFSFQPDDEPASGRDSISSAIYEELEPVEMRKVSTRNPVFSTTSSLNDEHRNSFPHSNNNIVELARSTFSRSKENLDELPSKANTSIEFKYKEDDLEELLDSPSELFSLKRRTPQPETLEFDNEEHAPITNDASSEFMQEYDLDEEDLRVIEYARSMSKECDEQLTEEDLRLIGYARSVSEIQKNVEHQYYLSLESSEIAEEVTVEEFEVFTDHYKNVLKSLKLRFKPDGEDDNDLEKGILERSIKPPMPRPRSVNLTLSGNGCTAMEQNVEPQPSESKDTGTVPKVEENPESIASGASSETPGDLSMENLYESNSSSEGAISSRDVVADSSYMEMFKKPEDKVYESLSPVKEKRDYFTFTVKSTSEKIAEPSRQSSDKVNALKKRFEESGSRDETHPHEEPAAKDTLVCGPTFHNINQMSTAPSSKLIEQKKIENVSYSEVKIQDQNLEAAEETEKKHIDIGNSRESFELAKKIFENNGK